MSHQASKRNEAIPVDRPSPEAAPGRRRLPRGEREERIIEAAAALFADVGFEAPTRALAGRLGVTQALLYRYFPSKQHLIERVLKHTFGRLQARTADPGLRDRRRAL